MEQELEVENEWHRTENYAILDEDDQVILRGWGNELQITDTK
jgi:hypothetical protein